MKKLLFVLAAVSTGACAPAHADQVRAKITDSYGTEWIERPYSIDVCSTVDVPIYSNNNNAAGDAFVGMVLGGLLGKGISGNDDGAAAGAVIGGLIGADQGSKNKIVGYRKENRCTTEVRYEKELKNIYEYSIIEFTHNGKNYRLSYQK